MKAGGGALPKTWAIARKRSEQAWLEGTTQKPLDWSHAS
jgi:hypothetical protein